MLSLKFMVESVSNQLKMIRVKEIPPTYTPIEIRTITLIIKSDDPKEWEFFELGKEYSVTIDRSVV